MTRTSETWSTMCAIMTTRTWLLHYAHNGITCIIHVFKFMCAVWKVLWIVVVPLSLVSCSVHRRRNTLDGHAVIGVVLGWILQSSFAFVVRLYYVIVKFTCSQILAHLYIAKTGHCRIFCQNTVGNGSLRSLKTWHSSFLTVWIIRRPPGALPIPPCRRWTLCQLPLFVLVTVSRHEWFFSYILL